MKVLVTVKEVAVVQDEFTITGQDIDEGDLDFALNEWDDYAVEEAVQLSEEFDDVEVVTVTIGPERSDEVIRKALAKGADRAIRVWDDQIEGAEYLDVNAKAEILGAVIEDEDPDLVLSGVQSGDDNFGATGVRLARKVGYEWAAVVNELDFDPEEQIASVHRELEGGVEELAEIQTPAVLTIQTGINEPRYASLRGIRQAQSKPLETMTTDEIGLTPENLETPVQQTSMYEPESESNATIWEGDIEEEATELAKVLRNKGVVEG